MSARSLAPLRRFVVPICIAILALAPALAAVRPVAAADLLIGGAAQIVDADGDPVNLRDSASLDAGILAAVPEGSIVDLLSGPVASDDGMAWYRVAFEGQTGYMSADFLAEYTGDGNGGSGDGAVVTSRVNLRGGPSTADDVVTVLDEGENVTLTGGMQNGFYPASTANGDAGWVYGAYLAVNGSGTGSSARTNDALNLRSGPSTGDNVILVMPAGSAVTITGNESNGFLPVTYNGTSGWASAHYLSSSGQPAQTTDDVNFRAGPSLSSNVIRVVASGRTVLVTGDAVDGFYPVDFDGESGWISTSFVSVSGAVPTTPTTPTTPAPEPVASAIVWPMSGGEWTISQGYHGPYGHYSSGLWAYDNSFDLIRTDGSTAGQTVYAPVNGTVTWTEAATGGIAIDIGNGHAVALFHLTLDPSIGAGDTVSQGEVLGTVSGPGGPGYSDLPHIHITLWETSDGGNWSRTAAPFTGDYAISGESFPDTGEASAWSGTLIYP